MKKSIALFAAMALVAFLGYGCVPSGSGGTTEGGITMENHGRVGSDTSETKLYYPNTINGTTGGSTMTSGFTGDLGDIEWMSKRVAEAGFVVLAFTPRNVNGFVSQWRNAHKDCIQELKNINSSHRVLRGKIDTGKLNVSGHSKGGGGSLWASAQLGSQLATTVPFAPYEEGFADSALRTITAATFIEAGASDSLANNSMTRGEYNGLGNISKKYVEYTGYDHMAWASATGTRATRMANDAIAWMKYYMNGDTSQSSTISNQSGTSRFEWEDRSSGSSSGPSTCN